jgi:hypothetical protein
MTLTEAFVPGPRTHVPGAAAGPLAGLSFAVKDLIDVAGVPTGGGNPDWPRFAPTPARHAWAVQILLDAGASVAGKTITDEVSLGILGENAHDGTPLNPAALGRGCRGLRFRAGHRYRRLGARAGELLRPLRHPADAWADRFHRHCRAGTRQ